MKRSLLKSSGVILTLLCAATVASADIKVKTRTTTNGQSNEGTTYIKKSRQRTEQDMGAMKSANILQCDLNRTVQINDAARTYMITLFNTAAEPAEAGAATNTKPATPQAGPTRRGGTVTTTTTIQDTGERKQMFGLTARRIKTSMVMESSPDACQQQKMRWETDGWYVDLQYGLDCQWNRPAAMPMAAGGRPDCVDQYRQKTLGGGKLGYPLLLTTIIYDDKGQQSMTMTTEVLELSKATLDPALFEIPAGYTEAKSYQELYAIATPPSIPSTSAASSSNEGAASAAAASAAVPGTVAAGTPKKAGVVRIGLVIPKAQMTEPTAGVDAAEAVRNTMAGFLKRPSIEVVMLSARAPAQAMDEARQSQCDYVLFSGLTQKKGGGMFGKMLGNVASSIPYGGGAGEAAARTTVGAGVYTTAALSGSIKAKDEVTFEYKLQAVEADQKVVATNSTKVKAKSDGEDVITPLIQKAAEVVAVAVQR